MGTVKDKILNALTLFYQAIKSVFVQTTNVVNNCASTSTTYPLSANQGTQLQSQIDDINSIISNKFSISAITVNNISESTYTSSVTSNSRVIKSLYLVVLSEQVTLTLNDAVSAGTTIKLGSISNYKPGLSIALSIWQNSTQSRRYMGYVGTDGTIAMKSNTDMPTGMYYIYIHATYIPR